MNPIRLKVRDREEVIETLLVEDRGCGIDIRQEHKAQCDAGSTEVVDLMDENHCGSCTDSMADRMELTPDEVKKITRWRHRKEDGVSSRKLGEILDKMVKNLDQEFEECDRAPKRIVIEVENG